MVTDPVEFCDHRPPRDGVPYECAAEIKLRAERMLGEMLATSERHPAGRPPEEIGTRPEPINPPKLIDLGISKKQSSRAQQLAKIPEATFEEYLDELTARLPALGSICSGRAQRAMDDQLPHWTLASEGAWEFVLSPYRGVLLMVRQLGGNANAHVRALVETPDRLIPAPHPFMTIRDAQAWVERVLYSAAAAAGHEGRRYERRRKDDPPPTDLHT